MGDSSSASLEAEILGILSSNFKRLKPPVKADRKRIAAQIHSAFSGCDFNDDDLGCYDELLILGLAKKCKVCGEAYTDWSEDQHGKGECDDDDEVED